MEKTEIKIIQKKETEMNVQNNRKHIRWQI